MLQLPVPWSGRSVGVGLTGVVGTSVLSGPRHLDVSGLVTIILSYRLDVGIDHPRPLIKNLYLIAYEVEG